MRAAFPVPNYEPRVCRWGCSVAPAAEKEQRRRAERSDGGAEEAEVRVGELPGPPRHSGNGLAARRAGPGGGRPVAGGFAPRGDPAPPPQHLGLGGQRGLLRSAGAGGARSAGPPAPGLLAGGRSAATCLAHAAAPRSRHALRGAARAEAGLGLGARGPLRPPAPSAAGVTLRLEWRAVLGAVVAVTDTFGGRSSARAVPPASRCLPSSEFLGEEALGKYCCHFRGTRLQLFGQSGCGPSTRCSGGVCG